jgi:hypothetical protein
MRVGWDDLITQETRLPPDRSGSQGASAQSRRASKFIQKGIAAAKVQKSKTQHDGKEFSDLLKSELAHMRESFDRLPRN